jgi:hypothetical protein
MMTSINIFAQVIIGGLIIDYFAKSNKWNLNKYILYLIHFSYLAIFSKKFLKYIAFLIFKW